MSVSVVIPTFNRAHTLERALSSVFQQSRQADEIIVVDDGSTDGSRELLKQRYPEVQVLSTRNQGVSAARNHGIRLSRNPWIALLDSDDEWLPHKLERVVQAAEQQTSYRLVHSDEIWVRNGTRVNPMKKHAKSGGWIFQRCLPLCAISPSATLIHRSVFDEIGLFDTLLPACEDYDLWLRVCASMPVAYVDEALIIKYGGHEDQLSHKYWGMDRFRIKALQKVIDGGLCKPEDELAAREMLVFKAGILLQGAQKRDRQQEAVSYQQLIEKYKVATCH